jgi:hypothetical protein
MFGKEEMQRKSPAAAWGLSDLEFEIPKASKIAPTVEKEASSIKPILKKLIDETARVLGGQMEKTMSEELREEIALLKRQNEELRSEVNKLYKLVSPLVELISEEIKLDKKILKEMPELKFKKKDPFVLEKGDWALPYEKLKKALEE